MENLEILLKEENGSFNINWNKVEENLGFKLHQDLKVFYSKVLCDRIEGEIQFVEENMTEKTGHERNDKWLSNENCEYVLFPITSVENASADIKGAFAEWTGGNDFGHRAMLGQFYFNRGEILILFNNDTGKVEWLDLGYGYFRVYDENPNGILANSISEFLKKIC